MASNGSSRTPFDDDLVDDPGAPKGTQPLPTGSPGGAQPIRPSRLLPPQAGSAPAPYGGVTPVTPPVGSVPPPPNDTSQLSLKRTPLSTIIGFSMAGGAVAVLLISALVRGVVHRSLSVTNPPAPASGMIQPTPLNSELMPTPGAVETDNVPATDTQNSAAIAPPPAAPRVANVTTTHSPAHQPDKRPTVAPTAPSDTAQDAPGATLDNGAAPVISTDTKPTPAPTPAQQAASATDDATPHPYTHHRAGYVITPPAGFTLVRRGQRTVWRGPDGATLLVETTTRPGRSPFGDWLRLDAMLRQKYGQRYRSHGINNTTVAGQPAALWDFELDTKAGPVRKIDVGVHSNGRGYAILGSVPLLKFDAARGAIEAAIRSFDLTLPSAPRATHHRRALRQDDAESSEGAAAIVPSVSQPSDDLRPDAGY